MAFAKVSDELALDLQFAADKSLTARVGPTPTFTRASTATYFAPSVINAVFTHSGEVFNVNTNQQLTTIGGRYSWQNGDTVILYDGSRWLLSQDGETKATSAPTNAWRPDLADWSGTGAIITPTSTFGIVRAASGEPRFDYDTTAPNACRGLLIEESRTNLVFPSATLTTQTRTVGATAYTLSFYGTGTVVLSGARVATVTGTGAFPTRTTLTFTPTAGSLTLTVTGTVQFAQLEAGAFASSYIPTTTGSVVRSADVCSITGEDFTSFYNEFAGTVLCESTLNGTSLSVTAGFGGQQNGISMFERTGAQSLQGLITSDENTTFNSFTGNVPSGVARKSAMAFQNEGSAILCLNGTLGTQDNSITLPSNSGNGQTPTSLYLFGGQFSTVKSFRYYKKRLANAKLQSLTQFASDPDANAYIVSLLAAGATLNTPQQNAINTFVSGEKTAGRWDGIKRLYFPVWGLAAANAICMKSLTSGTFSGAMTHGAGFITSTGGVLLSNTNLPALGITVDSHHLAFLSKRSGYRDYKLTISAFPNGVSLGTADSDFRGRTLDNQIVEYAPQIGIFSYGGTRTSRYLKQRTTGNVLTLGTNSFALFGDFLAAEITLMGSSLNSNFDNGDVGVISLGTALTDAADTTYTASLKTLWETVTGLTLP
jgi:hypothetical protein